jgi:hypothetical protein
MSQSLKVFVLAGLFGLFSVSGLFAADGGKVKVQNNCGRDVELMVMHSDGSLETVAVADGKTVEMDVKVGSELKVDGKSVYQISAGDLGKEVGLCN